MSLWWLEKLENLHLSKCFEVACMTYSTKSVVVSVLLSQDCLGFHGHMVKFAIVGHLVQCSACTPYMRSSSQHLCMLWVSDTPWHAHCTCSMTNAHFPKVGTSPCKSQKGYQISPRTHSWLCQHCLWAHKISVYYSWGDRKKFDCAKLLYVGAHTIAFKSWIMLVNDTWHNQSKESQCLESRTTLLHARA